MTVKIEGRHAAEFVLSEANGHRSRENGVVASGANLPAGQVVAFNGDGRLIAFTAEEGSEEGVADPAAVGVLLYPTDATLAHTPASYIARDAEVNVNLITFPDETTTGDERALTVSSLAALGIIAR